MQIKEKWLHWFEDILIHCFAWYHEQSFRINYDQKTEWHSWNSSHAFKCSNENEMQAIYDLDVTKFTSWSSSHCVRLQDQVRDLHAKSKCHQSIWSSLAHQIAAHAENEKNVELYSWMSMQLSKEQRNIIDIQWAKKHYARDKCKHISRVFHFIDFLSIFQRKFNWKCKALRIKIEVLDFVNDINILVYDRFIEEICKTLSKTYDVCAKWAQTHDTTFASEKYELTHFIRKSRKFNMMTSIQIENSMIKLKSNMQVLEVQLNMKLWWDAHLRQIEVSHVTRMLMLSHLEVFTWEEIFAKARQVYSAVMRSEITFKASVWHQRDKEKKPSNKKCRLETL